MGYFAQILVEFLQLFRKVLQVSAIVKQRA